MVVMIIPLELDWIAGLIFDGRALNKCDDSIKFIDREIYV